MSKTNKDVRCSFCDARKQDVMMLIAGLNGHICDRCITQGYQILTEEFNNTPGKKHKPNSFDLSDIKPIDIKNHLDQYVIGQDDAQRSEERSVGKGGVSTCRYRGAPENKKK